MANRRTVIAPNEELLVQGQLTVVGNVVQVEETTIVTNFENDVLIINSDGTNADATLSLNKNGSYGNITFGGSSITVSQPIIQSGISTMDITGDVYASNGTSKILENGSDGSDAVFTGSLVGNADSATILQTARNFSATGDVSASPVSFNGSNNVELNVILDTVNTNTGSFGDAATVPNFTVNGKGLITAAGETAVNITSSQVSDFTSSVRGDISATFVSGDGAFSYNSSTGVFSMTGPSAAETRAHFSGSSGVNYNSGTGAITADTGEIRGMFSANDAGGDGSLTYSNGVFTYTGPSASEVRAHFSAGTGIAISSGVISSDDSAIAHDSLSGFVANEHIDHSGVILTAGAGLTGGGDITASRTFNVVGGDGITANANDIAVDSTVVRTSGNQSISGTKTFTGAVNLTGATVTVQTEANSDSDSSVASTGYVNNRINQVIGTAPAALDTLGEIATSLANNTNIAGVVTNNTTRISALEGIDLVAGNGLTGGATDLLSAVTFNVGAGTGITVNSNDVAVNMGAFSTSDLSEGTNLYYTNARADARVNLQTGSNLDLSSKSTSDLSEGTNLYYTDARVESYLSGGDGVDFASGVIDVDNTVVRTSGNQTIAGAKTFSGTLAVPSSASTTTGAIYYDNSLGEAYIYVNGSARKITPAVDAGDVEDVGTGEVNIYAGTRVDGSTTYHGIKSLSSGTYTTLAEASNVITIDGDVSAIRGAFSHSDAGGDGSFDYNSSTGVFTYNGPTASETRAHFAGSGLISYDSGTGVFSTSADNYASWQFTTGSSGNEVVASSDLVTLQGTSGVTVTHSGKTITIAGQNGDISSVNAGSGLTGGATSGDATLNVGAGTGITVNANDVAVNMGAFDTSDLAEHSSALYYTDARARSAISVTDNGGFGSLSYDSGTGVITFVGTSTANIRSSVSAGGDLSYDSATGVFSYTTPTMYNDSDARSAISATGDLSYNSSTGVMSFTERTDAEVRALFSAQNLAGGYGTLSYDSTQGRYVYQGVTASEIRARFTGGTGIDISSGDITFDGSELPDMTDAVVGSTDEIIVLDNGVSKRKLFSEITLSDFNNDAGFTTNVGDITNVGAGNGLTGGGASGSVTLHVGAGSYINVNANDIAVDATSSNSASKVVARDASGNFSAGVITATATQAQYADLAEKYEADQNYQPGTVVIFGGEKEITVTDMENDYKVAGVISTDPAYKMNCDADGLYVALRGRIPCKVIGPVKKGDVLITSSRPGFAMASDQPHFVSASCIVGKALQDHPTPSEGVVEIVV